MIKNLPVKAGDIRNMDSILGLGRSPREGHGHPLQYSCLKNSMDRVRRLVGYSTWGHKESDRTELLSTHTHTTSHVCQLNIYCPEF